MNEFVIIMNNIYDNLKKLVDNPNDDVVYFELKKDLKKLDDLINSHKIPGDVLYKVMVFYERVYLKISDLRPSGDKGMLK